MHFPSVAELCPDPAQLAALGILEADLQGWNSSDPRFDQAITTTKPTTIIEVGTWKGASALHMANLRARRDYGPLPWKIYCVDTWLGGIDHLLNQDKPINDLKRDAAGFPRVYHQFLYNVATSLFANQIHPIVQTSVSGARLLGRAGIEADLINIDASHVYEDVYADLQHYLGLLAPGGLIIGDDWKDFAGVRLAVTRFAYEQGLELAVSGAGWQLRRAKA